MDSVLRALSKHPESKGVFPEMRQCRGHVADGASPKTRSHFVKFGILLIPPRAGLDGLGVVGVIEDVRVEVEATDVLAFGGPDGIQDPSQRDRIKERHALKELTKFVGGVLGEAHLYE
jgi:hypothetical protein